MVSIGKIDMNQYQIWIGSQNLGSNNTVEYINGLPLAMPKNMLAEHKYNHWQGKDTYEKYKYNLGFF